MMTVSSFLEVGGPPYRYTFMLVVRNLYDDKVREELGKQAKAFGADMRGQGLFVSAHDQNLYETADQVTDKEWPEDLASRMRQDPDPVLLVLDRKLREFDPRQHPYGLIWMSDFQAEPEQIRSVLQTLARMTRSGDDVIAYLREVAERAQEQAREEQAAAAVGLAARIASYFEIKPQVFGVSIDLKAILADIARRP